MGKIAAELNDARAKRALECGPGRLTPRALAEAPGWFVSDVIRTAGPDDRPFEERYPHFFIGLVVAGTFRWQPASGCARLTPGSLMVVNAELCFRVRARHGRPLPLVCVRSGKFRAARAGPRCGGRTLSFPRTSSSIDGLGQCIERRRGRMVRPISLRIGSGQSGPRELLGISPARSGLRSKVHPAIASVVPRPIRLARLEDLVAAGDQTLELLFQSLAFP